MSSFFQNGAFLNNTEHLQRRLCAAGVMIAFSYGVLQAQEIPESARQFIFDVGQRLEWSDNPNLTVRGGDSFTTRTTLQFTGFRRTRADELFFSLGGDLELDSNDRGSDNGIANTDVGLGWTRNVGHARTSVTLNYREVDLGSSSGSFFNEDTSSIDFGRVDSGTRQTTNLRLNGAFGIRGPQGGSYTLEQRRLTYSGTTDPDLQDADRLRLEGDLFFSANRRVTLGVDASYSDFDEDGPGELDTIRWRAGTFADVAFSSRLSGRFGLGWQEVEESGARNSTENGMVFDARLTQDMARSRITLGVESEIIPSGRLDQVRLGQSFELPRNELSYSIGLSRLSGFDTSPVFGLSWAQDLPRGGLRFSLEQRATTGRDNENLINSRMVFGYTQELNAQSGFDVEVSLVDRDNRADGGIDSQRYRLDLTYRHALYDDWDLTGGISVLRLQEDGSANRDANTLFVGLEKRFSWN